MDVIDSRTPNPDKTSYESVENEFQALSSGRVNQQHDKQTASRNKHIPPTHCPMEPLIVFFSQNPAKDNNCALLGTTQQIARIDWWSQRNTTTGMVWLFCPAAVKTM